MAISGPVLTAPGYATCRYIGALRRDGSLDRIRHARHKFAELFPLTEVVSSKVHLRKLRSVSVKLNVDSRSSEQR